MNRFDYLALMGYAARPNDEAVRAIAGVVSSGYGFYRHIPPPEFGLGTAEFTRMMQRLFPGALGAAVDTCGASRTEHGSPAFCADEYADLSSLLLDNLSREDETGAWLAQCMAGACLGGNHLWQDMGLPSRQALSSLIAGHFRPLYEKNVRDMKWKKFFYKQICEREGFYMCKSPNCESCPDFAKCFGREEDEDAETRMDGREAARC